MDLTRPHWRLAGKAALSLAIVFLGFSLACGPSDEEVARAAEESISLLAQVAVDNLRCSVSEAFSGVTLATETMERYSTRMEGLTGSLEDNSNASNREKMQVINEMNDLREDWEKDLEDLGCEVSRS